MKIAIIGSRGYPYVYSGYETFVKELSERLVKRGVEVRVYCHRGLFENRPAKVNGIELVYLPSIETKILSQLSHSFLAMVHCCFSRSVSHILVVNTANGPFGLISRLLMKPTAINLDGMEWLRPKWRGLGARYFYFASWLSTLLYDRLVNDSEEMRKVYLDLFKKESTVIAYGANIRESKNPALIQKWDLTPGGYYLIVGRLIPDNNSDIVLKGFLKSTSNRKLVIVGDVPFQDEFARQMKAEAEKDDRIIMTGYVTDQEELAELYHNTYCYIHGHEFGGTNPTMLKAMAYGSAILALDTKFTREMLQGDDFGLFFRKSETSVTDLINDLENGPDLVESYRLKIRRALTKKYDWDHVTDQYLSLFQEMTNSSP
ncbi:MAG: DUF1972 domain-containing protein [Bacteroidota bacterium]